MNEEKMRAEFVWQAATDSKQREIAELSAQVEVMREALASVYGLVGHATSAEIQDKARIALSITPSAALLAIENEAAAKALEDAARDLIGSPLWVEWLRKKATERRDRK